MLIFTAAVVLIIGSIFFAGMPQPASAQSGPFRSYQLRVYCEDLPAASFWHEADKTSMGVDVTCAGNCPGEGWVPLADALARFPAEVRTVLTSMAEKNPAAACVLDEKKPPDKKANCEKTGPYDMPWFDPSNPGCKNLQNTRMNANWTPAQGGTCTFTLTACNRMVSTDIVGIVQRKNGTIVSTNGGVLGWTPQQNAAAGFTPITRSECTTELYYKYSNVEPRGTVCCDIWNEAVSAGSGCNPEKDADCDGLPNERDNWINSHPYYAPYALMNPEDGANFDPANFDPRPPGLSWDEVMPNEPCKGCKWVALSGKLTCSPDKYKKMPESRKRDHEYKVTWTCPTSGVQRVVTKRVAAKFPCTPPKRPTPTSSAFRPASLQIFSSGFLTNPSLAALPGFWAKPCVGSQLDSNLSARFEEEED